MKLKELLKIYYETPKDVTMSMGNVISKVLTELILPGSFSGVDRFRKTLSWNLDRDVYYKEAYRTSDEDTLYVTITTGKMDFYFTFEEEGEFQDLLEAGLKKHRGYRKETLPIDGRTKFLFYSRRYE